jgi:hypothetical protein
MSDSKSPKPTGRPTGKIDKILGRGSDPENKGGGKK